MQRWTVVDEAPSTQKTSLALAATLVTFVREGAMVDVSALGTAEEDRERDARDGSHGHDTVPSTFLCSKRDESVPGQTCTASVAGFAGDCARATA